MAMRVDEVPWYLRPLVVTYSYSLGGLLILQYWLYHRTVRIEWFGRETLVPGRNYIFVLWHGDFPCYFTAFQRHERHAWIVHPLVYVQPAWILARFVGVERAILGSAGHGGKPAAEQLVRALQGGASTVMAPDGPSGPAKKLKPGVLHIAEQSGVAIVPLRFDSHPAIRAPGWDRKVYPIPFGRLEVTVGPPVDVSAVGLDRAAGIIERALT
jgi:lysophospholipid acyltransferase (LPLAT)-like uncharacterized protein